MGILNYQIISSASGAWKPLFSKRAKAKTPPATGWHNHADTIFEVRPKGQHLKSFIDPQHDVTTADIRQAKQEGFISVEHMKRYTTLGMATDQGRNGNVLGIAAMAEARGISIPEVGITTFRPPFTPISIGVLLAVLLVIIGSQSDAHQCMIHISRKAHR